MTTRSSKETALKKQNIVYSDFMGNLEKHPISGDIARVVNAESIKQSLKNLILFDFGDKLFHPNIGSNVRRSLFDPLTPFTLNNIKMYVYDVIGQFEPRVKLLDVVVSESQNSQNEVTVQLTFYIININETSSLNLILKRVR